jgi:hypothetical protein
MSSPLLLVPRPRFVEWPERLGSHQKIPLGVNVLLENLYSAVFSRYLK